MPSKPGKLAPGAAVLALAVGLVAHFEGYVPHTYADPVGIPTSCYGHVGAENRAGRQFTRPECQALLEGDLAIAYAAVRKCITVPLRDHEAAALVSFTFNVGPTTLCRSTLARMANARMTPGTWCPQLERFVYAGGIKLPGLVKRRAAERALCEGRT